MASIVTLPDTHSITIYPQVMTPEGTKVMITWMVGPKTYMVTGENRGEALRTMAQMEEAREEEWRGF